jgi:hypothetical protein
MGARFKKGFVWLGLLMCFIQLVGQATSAIDEEEQKKQADQFYTDEEYGNAYKLYSTLLANYPKDPKYNYRIGVCILFVGDEKGDRKKAISYLEFAKTKMADLDKEVLFYLGKAYHLNYRFDEAIRNYKAYDAVGSSSNKKKLMVEREIKSANHAKDVVSRGRELKVIEKKRLASSDYFKTYNKSFYGGDLLVKTDNFKIGLDKKKKDRFILFLSKDKSVALFSSYGETGERGKDIYMAKRVPNGDFGTPFPLPGKVNTEYDEDYPYLHPNGRELYFCSKGHNSIGGYDIFKSTWDEASQAWGQPANLNFPINTPADDIQFVTDSTEKLAIFSSTRYSEFGKIDVYKIDVERRPMEFSTISGLVVQKQDNASKAAKISIKDITNERNVGTFAADDRGYYNLKIPNGSKLLFTVETPGFTTQSEGVNPPLAYDMRPYKQVITYEGQKLVIQNFYDEKEGEQAIDQMLARIEEQAQLNVNADRLKNNPALASTDPVKTTDPKTVGTTNDYKNMSNQQLLSEAKKDYEEINTEAKNLNTQAENAGSMAGSIKDLGNKKLKQADDILKNAETITDPKQKQLEIDKGNQLKEEAKETIELGTTAETIAQNLKEDAKNKQVEANLQQKFVQDMENVNKSPTKEGIASLQKTEEALRQHQEQTKTKKQDEITAKSEAEVNQKQAELAKLIKDQETIKQDLNQANTDITDKKKELASAKKKDDKAAISTDIANLEDDKKETEKKLAAVEAKIKDVQEQLTDKKEESTLINEVFTKAKTGDTDVSKLVETVAVSTKKADDTNTGVTTAVTPETGQQDVYKTKEAAVKDQLTALNTGDDTKEKFGKKAEVLKNWNVAIDEKIKDNKEKLKTSKDPEEKKKLGEENKLLETQKKDNTLGIADAQKKVKTAPTEADIAATKKNPGDSNTVAQTDPYKSKEDVFKNKLSEIAANDNTKENLGNRVEVLKDWTAAIDEKIKTNKELIKSSKNPEEKKALAAENKSLEEQKKDNNKEIVLAQNQVKTAPSNSELASKNSTDISSITEISEVKKAAEEKKTQNKNESELFAVKFEDPKAAEQKTEAKKKFDEAKESNEKILQQLNAPPATNDNQADTDAQAQIDKRLSEAEAQLNEAKKLRADAKTKNGPEKEKLIAQAVQLETKANDVKLVATKEQINLHEKTSGTQEAIIADLKAQSKNKPVDEITKANTLEEDIKKLSGKVTVLRNEADNQTDLGAKLGGYTNADDAEREILIKQQQVIDIYKKSNPDYVAGGSKLSTEDAKKTFEENEKIKSEALTTLGTANKSEYTALQPKVNTALKNSPNKKDEEAAQWRKKAGDLMKQADVEIAKAKTEKDPQKKNQMMAEALKKQEDAIILVQSATIKYNGGDVEAYQENIKKDKEKLSADDAIAGKTGDNKTGDGNGLTTTKTGGDGTTGTTTKTGGDGITGTTTKTGGDGTTGTTTKTGGDGTTGTTTKTGGDGTTGTTTKTGGDGITGTTTKTGDPNSQENKDGGIGNLSAEKVKQIKSTPEFKKYSSYKEKADKASENIRRDEALAQTSLTEAQKKMQESTDLRIKADALPDGPEKTATRKKAIDLEHEALKLKVKSDSLTELVSNTRPYEREQRMAADDYGSTLDKSTRENFDLVINAKTNSTARTPETNSSDPATNPSSKYAAYSPEFKNNAVKHDKELESYSSAEPNEQNLSSQNLILKNYTADIDKEVAAQKKLLAAAKTPAEKEKIKKKITTLTSQKTDKQQLMASNTARIQQIKKDEAIAKTGGNGTGTVTPTTTATTVPTTTNTATTATTTPTSTTTATTSTTTATTSTATTTPSTVIASNGLKVKPGRAYSDLNPIPIDKSWPDGIIYTVQVGAFKTPVPNDVFRGLNPINGTTAPSGFIRYQAGMFDKFTDANAAKNDMRRIGFKDAFVAVYKNGKRVSLESVLAENGGNGAMADNNSSLGITPTTNVPDGNTVFPASNRVIGTPVSAVDVSQVGGMFYTIQVGVYSGSISASQINNLTPVYRDQLPSGNFRYTAGIYNNLDKVKADRQKVIALGMADAFVTVYYDGKRITWAEASQKQNDGNVKYPPENPIRFSNGTNVGGAIETPTPVSNSVTPVNTSTTNGIQPFSNGVISDPTPTPENGVKLTTEGVVYKVQIGAYSKEVPSKVAQSWMKVQTWPVRNYTNDKGLFIYTIGSYGDFSNAKKLLNEALGVGIKDAFITVFKDGKRVLDAAPYMK